MSAALGFNVEHEAWNVYVLEDGTRIKMRIMLTRVSLEGVDENGNPWFKMDHALVAHIETPQLEGT